MNKQLILPTVLTLIGVSILIALGIWQLQRLQWKENILQQIIEKSENFQTFKHQNINTDNEFAQGEIVGHFLYDKEFAIKPRVYDGEPGIHVITPLKLPFEKTLLVNRGWAPSDYKLTTKPKNQPENLAVAVAGTIRTISQPNAFTPKNQPKQDEWYAINLGQIAEAKSLTKLLPVMFYEIDLLEGSHGTTYPTPLALEININNNHLQYALFWFAMALALIVVYTLRFLRKPQK